MVVFSIGRTLVNRVAWFIAAALLIIHPLHVYLSSLAGSDALLGLLVALAALVAIQLAREPPGGERSSWASCLASVGRRS